MKIVLYVILAIIILLLMIVIHEFGHYVAGKILKFKINEFSIGFGPKIIQKKKKNGELFSLRLIPLGGYCAFEGETDTENTDKLANVSPTGENLFVENAPKQIVGNARATKSFIDEKPWKRIIVLLAGGVFNIVSAVIFSFIVILIVGVGMPKVTSLYVPSVIQSGDQIVKIDGKEIDILNSFEELTKGSKVGDNYTVTVNRNGSLVDIILTVKTISYVDEKDGITKSYDGFGFKSERVYESCNIGTALLYSVPYTIKLSWAILGSFFDLVTGQIPITSLTGPVGTIGMMAELSAFDWRNILLLLPLIASNLGLFNLLPIPALDGSKVVFTTIEWVRGKPINRKVENYIHTIGLFVLFAFVIVIDIIGMILR